MPERRIGLNGDAGECLDPSQGGEAREAEFVRHLTAVNIACGGHAGDEGTMRTTVRLAIRFGCEVGAHPSYPDREGFGRRRLAMRPSDLAAALAAQIAALARIAEEEGAVLRHVKPHGALYHAAGADPGVAEAIAEAAERARPGLVLVAQAGSPALGLWRARGLGVAAEGFADRRYLGDGSLCSRTRADALVADPGTAARQALVLAGVGAEGDVPRLPPCETVCVHGDTPGAPAIAAAVRAALEGADVLAPAGRRLA